ncbi:MAG: polysaccharide deacetylase family protein [Candidatus Latescibacterota bacterium]
MKAVNLFVPDRYFVSHIRKAGSGVYLTFDDSPHPEWTPRSMDVLDQLGIKACFFMVGQEAMRHAGMVREVTERGHSVGNHTYSHRSIVGLTRKDLEVEVVESGKRLSDLSGQDVKMFRPPWGKLDLRTARFLISKGQQIVMWSVDSTDYKYAGADDIMTRINEVGVKAGDILLFHDDNEHTVAALPRLAEKVRGNNLKFNELKNC